MRPDPSFLGYQTEVGASRLIQIIYIDATANRCYQAYEQNIAEVKRLFQISTEEVELKSEICCSFREKGMWPAHLQPHSVFRKEAPLRAWSERP